MLVALPLGLAAASFAASAETPDARLDGFRSKYRMGMEIEVGFPQLNVIVDDFDFNGPQPRPSDEAIARAIANGEWLEAVEVKQGRLEVSERYPELRRFAADYLRRHPGQVWNSVHLDRMRTAWGELRVPQVRAQIPADLNQLDRTVRTILVATDAVSGARLPLKPTLEPRIKQVYDHLDKSRDQSMLEFRHREDFAETDPQAYLKTVETFLRRVLRPEDFGQAGEPLRPAWSRRQPVYQIHISATDGRSIEAEARAINLVTQLELYGQEGAKAFGPSHALTAYNDLTQKGLVRLFARDRIELRARALDPKGELVRTLEWLENPAALRSHLRRTVAQHFARTPDLFLRQMFTRSDERAFYFARDLQALEDAHGVRTSESFGRVLPELIASPIPAIQDAAAMTALLFMEQAAVRNEFVRSTRGWTSERIDSVFTRAFGHLTPSQRRVALTGMLGGPPGGALGWSLNYLKAHPEVVESLKAELRAVARLKGANFESPADIATAEILRRALAGLHRDRGRCLGRVAGQVKP